MTNDPHTNRYGEPLAPGQRVYIDDDPDTQLTPLTRARPARIIRAGPLCIIDVDGVGVRGCVDRRSHAAA